VLLPNKTTVPVALRKERRGGSGYLQKKNEKEKQGQLNLLNELLLINGMKKHEFTRFTRNIYFFLFVKQSGSKKKTQEK